VDREKKHINKSGFINLKEHSMDNETVVSPSMDSETISILLDDRVATGG
jgi:hypothetical protein